MGSLSTTIHEENREEENSPLQISSAVNYEVWNEDELNLPRGYRFSPYEHELIVYYLANKILGRQLPADIIRDIDLYDHDPHQLPIDAFTHGKPNEAYFFTHTERKYNKGMLPRRTTNSGYWKATGGDMQIFSGNEIVGFKKILVFYEGKVPRGIKTSWIMYEYRINPQIISVQALNDHINNELERLVVCRIQYREDNGIKRRKYSLAKSEYSKQRRLPN